MCGWNSGSKRKQLFKEKNQKKIWILKISIEKEVSDQKILRD